ncbi:MAG: PrsW family intramembrane metalloprotease [Chlorogloeopsis fritschii C42_A2020_084]|uniref:PrsW family intramembrane metalloprotease n=1 Tax=Chlorogloeopsis fritschii TaxID=1124 RepID=UPI0019F6FFFE|nr:PrsW family glutamic-type intramembrane protease [Chlorogloeopsis fritschii]MBF2004115.1 PrsW family intramembrane metalloprotease [Chlorogloeopsis fritschii C42_A2020_084]
MANFFLVLWAVTPPLLLLIYYYRRVSTAPSLLRLLLFFVFGAISGFVALSLGWVVETHINSFAAWREIRRTLVGVALRQVLVVGPIEEGCKIIAVLVPSWYFQRRYRLRPSSIFLFTIAVALGFTAQENWIYLFHETASVFDRAIGTPVHAMFSAPWGYALALFLQSKTQLRRYTPNIPRSWFNSVICHALVNFLSSSWRYPAPLFFLSYGLFPFFVWMFWRLEQLLRKVQGKTPIILISGYTPQHRLWEQGLVVFALMLGGNAIFGLFLLVRSFNSLSPSQVFYPGTLWLLLSRFLLNLIFGLVAWTIYCYLRYSARRRYFK